MSNQNHVNDSLTQDSSIIPSSPQWTAITLDDTSDPTSVTNVDRLIERLDAYEIHRPPRDIDDLPMEIVANFFNIASYYDYKTAIAISHVCRQWRTAALGTPEMWSSLDMGTHTQLALFKLFVDRSNRCPLDIKLEICDVIGGLRLDDADPALDEAVAREDFIWIWLTALVAHVSRWRSFQFEVPFETDFRRVALQLSVLEAPLLESFVLTIIHETVDVVEKIPSSWPILRAPGLRSLSLNKYRLDLSSIGSKLVSLTIDCDDQYLEYLTHCVALRSAYLSFVLPLSTQRQPITHSGLQDLGITFHSQTPWGNVVHVLSSLLAPSLVTLKLYLYFAQEAPPSSFIQPIESTTLFPQLTRLLIEIEEYRSRGASHLYKRHCRRLSTLLKRMSTTTHLELHDVQYVKELFNALGSSVLPRMHSLQLHQCSEVSSTVMGTALEDMLKSRQREDGLVPVHSLEVRYCPGLSRIPYEDSVKELVPDLLWLSYRTDDGEV